MGLFDFFKPKKQVVTNETAFKQTNAAEVDGPKEITSEEDKMLLELTEVKAGITLPKAFAKHWDEIEKTRLTYISIKAKLSRDLSIQQSSFGYYPCLPKGYPYPTDKDGNPMFPLAQINCSEIPVLSGYPNFGYLQFYIANDDSYGVGEGGMKVLYFAEDEVKDFETDFSSLNLDSMYDSVPVNKPHKLEFEIKEEYFGVSDARTGEGEDLLKIADQYPSIADELQEYVWDTFSSNGHKMGGYAYFTNMIHVVKTRKIIFCYYKSIPMIKSCGATVELQTFSFILMTLLKRIFQKSCLPGIVVNNY